MLSLFLFAGCPNKDDKEAVDTDTTALLYSTLFLTRFNCADVRANSDTAQIIPFRTVSSTNNYAAIYFNITTGQKISISSVTTDLSTKTVSINTACSSGISVSTSSIFSRANTATNITLTALSNYEGLLTLSFTTKPTDLTVQILP